jgi:4-amino-4-deoxy-L-arabinose transferase-like glycosyltransferase
VFRPLDDRQRCSRLIVALILVLALAVRIGWSIGRPTDEASLANLPDQVEYLSLAKSLLAGNGLQMVDPRFNDTVQAFRMPGYPVFCAALRGDLSWIRIAQAILDASTVLATLWLARRWLSPMIAYLAALIVALDPIQIYFSSLILSETLFVTLLTWGVACLAHGRSPMARGSGAATWWGGIVLLILSIYVRPSALLFPVLLAGASVLHEHGTIHFKAGRRVPVLTLVALLTAIALLPWAIRNRTLLGEWVFTTTNDGFTLYDAWNADAVGGSDQSGLARLPLLSGLSETQRSRYLREIAFEQLRESPARMFRNLPRNLGRLWTPWPLSAEFGAKREYVIGAAAHALPLFVLAMVGLLFRSTIPRGAKVLLFTPILIVTISHALTLGSLRYRMPIHPELAVLAAAALVWQRHTGQYEEAAEPVGHDQEAGDPA